MKKEIYFIVIISICLFAFSCSNTDEPSNGNGDNANPFYTTRGVLLAWDDVLTFNWLDRAIEAGINTISVSSVDYASNRFQQFLIDCRNNNIDVEYDGHAIGFLLPRDLFNEHPEYFRMNKEGSRVNDYNCCPSSEEALDIIADNTILHCNVWNKPTTLNYNFWLDDVDEAKCYCPKCRNLNPSDQALLIENRIVRELKQKIHPDCALAHLAYHTTMEPPQNVIPEDGIYLRFAPFLRTWSNPISDRNTMGRLGNMTHGEILDLLEANLEIFPVETAQVLEYWLDVSLFSNWTRPAAELPWNKSVFESDINTYANYGIKKIMSYATWIDGDYIRMYGDPYFIDEYGEGLMGDYP